MGGGADPPSLSEKWEVYPGEKCPTGVRAVSPAKKHRLDRDLTFSLKSRKIEVPLDGIAKGFLCLIMDHKVQLCCRNVTIKKAPDQGPESKQELELGK